ncbi:WecB/TagA/CpsF family glycosyltransferase [Clostridium sp. AWRP]|uniref:WecB/TagA/CpsF family glycosyltransferase n=1 Tax=Clostridium sp. AWRP TaxID=2212991 RepID=UPI0026A93BD9
MAEKELDLTATLDDKNIEIGKIFVCGYRLLILWIGEAFFLKCWEKGNACTELSTYENVGRGSSTKMMETEYKRKVDKSKIPTCNIMGVNIAAIDMDWLLDYLNANVKELKGNYITVANVHTTVTAYEDLEYCAVQNGGIMAIPDGGPLSSVGNKRGYKNMHRTTGPNLMGEIFKISTENGYRHYFYGSTDETLKALYQKLTKKYLGIQIAGMYSPPFHPLTEEEDVAVIKKINETKPDFIWIGLGAPKQEKWMAAHQGKLDGLMVGVGAGFAYHAEQLKRAPEWMQKSNLEWVYRLIQDPGRLFKRYWHTNTKFIWNAVIRGK